MTDIEDRLRSAMHAAVDGKEASARELISRPCIAPRTRPSTSPRR